MGICLDRPTCHICCCFLSCVAVSGASLLTIYCSALAMEGLQFLFSCDHCTTSSVVDNIFRCQNMYLVYLKTCTNRPVVRVVPTGWQRRNTRKYFPNLQVFTFHSIPLEKHCITSIYLYLHFVTGHT